MNLLEQPARTVPLAVVDLELTGLDPNRDEICEVAVVRREADGSTRTYQALVRPSVPMSRAAEAITGLSDAVLAKQPPFGEVADEVREWLAGAVFVAHNVPSDLGYLQRAFEALGEPLAPVPVCIDTLEMSRRLFAFPRNNLSAVCERLGIAVRDGHRALGDATATLEAFETMCGIVDPAAEVSVDELLGLLGALMPNSPTRLGQQQLLRESFRQRVTVWIDYISTSDPLQGLVHREVAIWHMKLPRLQGWCYLREGERVFRLDRIRDVRRGVRKYEIPTFRRRI